MNLSGLIITMQSIREPIPAPVVPPRAIPVVFAEATVAEPVCGNGLYPRPCHDPAVNNGCSEHDIEAPELDNDGLPCDRVLP